MGIGGMSIWQLLIILIIVLLLFGTKRLKGLGGDLGGAIKGFKKAMTDEEEQKKKDEADEQDVKKVAEDEKVTATTTSESQTKSDTKQP